MSRTPEKGPTTNDVAVVRRSDEHRFSGDEVSDAVPQEEAGKTGDELRQIRNDDHGRVFQPLTLASDRSPIFDRVRHACVMEPLYRQPQSETLMVDAMQTLHPIFGELVTSNRLIRGGRWVFRGTIVPLEDVFADLASGMTLQAVWEKHDALDRRDLEAVAMRALGENADVLRELPSGVDGRKLVHGHTRNTAGRAVA